MLDEAERWFVRGPVPDVHPIAAMKTRIWLAQNRLPEALVWAREQGLSTEDSPSYLHEFEHITLARLLTHQYRNDGADLHIQNANEFLTRLLIAAEQGGRMGSLIEILILQSLAHKALGDIPSALAPLERALTLAEPEGYVRIFVDEGEPMARLLFEAVARRIIPDYAGKLLAVIKDQVFETGRTILSVVEPALDRTVEPTRAGCAPAGRPGFLKS